MDHVSRPLLVVLGATVALLALWLVALRPKPVSVEHTPLAPTKEIAKARQAVGLAAAANAKAQSAGGGAGVTQAASSGATGHTATPAGQPAAQTAARPTTPPATSATPKAAASTATARHARAARRDAAVMRLVTHGKVVVMLFWNATSADDIATRGALRDIDRHGGKVVVRIVPITDVAQYPSITRGVKIAQSPTTVIIGHNGRARVIAGLSEPREISQAVGDALAGR
jgi:hypothetical protein